jgi:cytidylate kinase
MDTTVITVSGYPGSGTTTVAQILANNLGFTYYNTGMIFRKLATEHTLDLNAFEHYCEEHPETDMKLDEAQEQVMRKGKAIMEGRLSGWIAYKKNISAFKVWLNCTEEEAIKRIINRENGSYKEKKEQRAVRILSESTRYSRLYDIDLNDFSAYDLIIDTTLYTATETAKKILGAFEE